LTDRFRSALILHPNLLTRKAVRRQLMLAGFERVLEAEDDASAIALASQERLDVVFTPFAAGELKGAALFRALRARDRKAAPVLVLLDDGVPPPARVAAVKAGLSGRLTLPVQPEQVQRLLAELSAPAPA
jgi:CheY-like chemotaxis protein